MGKRGGAGTEYKDKPPEQKKDGTVVKSYQRMPTQILNEWCQGQKRPKPEFRGVRSYDRSLCRFKVVLPDAKDVSKSLEFEANRDAETPFAAREEAALVALLKLCSDLPLERKLPDGYRETWLEAIGEATAPKAKPKSKAAAKPKAATGTVTGKEAAEQEKKEALARKAQEEQLQELKEEPSKICFEWQRSGRCRRPGCRFDHPPATVTEAHDATVAEVQEDAGEAGNAGGWSRAPLGAVHGHMSRAEKERERREKKEAWAQEKNKREAIRDLKRLANMKARIILARRMRELIFKSLDLGAEFSSSVGEAEELTDIEAAALHQLTELGFEFTAAQRALLAHRDARENGETSTETSTAELAEKLRVWLCLHLPEEEIPEAFAPHRGQFEVHRPAAKPLPAVVTPEEEFFGWMREAMEKHLEDAEAAFATAEVLLRTEGDAHEQEEALVAAKAFLEGEGMPEEVLEELQARWASLHIAPPAEEAAAEPAAAAEATGVSAAPEEAEEAALGSHEAVLEEVEVVQVEVKKTKGAPRMWFGWKAEAPTGSWQQSAQGQKMKKVREALPAFKVKDELSKLLASDQVVLVHGETGSGKTTQIGQFLVEAAGGARVVVTQPRRFAALSVARRVAEERGEELGQNAVGYMVRGETKMHPARCQLLFCTLGVLLRRLIAQGSEEMFSSNDMTHLVLDEVHERSMDMDFVLTLLRHALPSRPKLKVLLMSATMDIQSLGQLFPKTPPVLKIPGRTFPVDVLHLEDVEDLLGSTMPWSSAAPRDGAATLQPAAMNYEVLADFVTKLADGTLQGADASWPTHGAILVFMPGAGEISRLINALARRSSAFKALPLHGALSGEQQRRCFETFQVRKVIVATNVAETSVTLPDVTIVIDTCRERRLTREHGHSSLAPALLERFCAKDSLQQRRGRAGRVQKGVCFRLVPRKAYDKLPEATAAEIEALPLETLVLQVRAAGYAPEAFLAKAPTPPEAWQVRQAELELRQIGALKQEEESGAPAELLTALGRHLVALPCDVRVGRLLVLGAFLGVASAACSIAGWLSVRSPMPKAWQPDQETLRDTLRAKALRGGGGKSDHCFWVAIMDAFMAAKSRKAFCNDLGLSLERMVEAELCRTQLLRGLRSLGFQRDADGNAGDWHIVRAAVVAGLYPQVVSVERPTPKFAESLAGAIQIESDAREVRYWLSEDGGRARAFLHPSSLLFKESSYSCPYIIFSEKTIQQQNNPEHPTKLVLTGCSEASVYALLLFGGHLTVDHQQVEVTVDGGRGGRFAGGSTTVVAMLQRLRQAIDALLLQKVHSPSSSISGAKAAQCVVTLLSTDGLGPETEKK